MKFVLAGALALAVCLLAGCASQISTAMSKVDPSASMGSPDAAATVRNTDLSARFPTTTEEPPTTRGWPQAAATVLNNAVSARFPTTTTVDQQPGRSDASNQPLLFPGADTPPLAPASSDPGSGQRTASLEPVTMRGDGVEMNFENAEIHA